MKVWIFETNLMWGPRLRQSIESFGYEVTIVTKITPDMTGGSVAIVNLSSPELDPMNLVRELIEAGVYVIGHAGHKEKELHALGLAAGCSRTVTNGELTFKVEHILLQAAEELSKKV